MQLLTSYFYFRELGAHAIYETRLELEPLMVRAAIDHLTAEDFATLRGTIDLCRGRPSTVRWTSSPIAWRSCSSTTSSLSGYRIRFCGSSACS
jgi:DNA-binding FadR family transcriptional regulator